jgi:hypothetical protein
MADINYNDYGIAAALGQLAQAQEAQAMRPQKSSVFTRTTSTSTPRALEDMIMRRNSIGANNQRLLDALKGRETAGYGISNALSQLGPVRGYGDWGVNALRTLGAGIKGYTDSAIAREQAAQELTQKDLETALAFDKAMGETQTQTQDQTIGYEELPYSNAGKVGNSSVGGGSGIANYLDLPDIDVDALNKKAGSWETNEYNPSDQNQSWMKNFAYRIGRGPDKDYGVALSKKTDEAKAFEQFKTEAMQGMFDVLKYLRPATDTDVMVALSTAGADPVLDSVTRDQRLTKTLNQELRKGNLAPVKNLRHWQDAVRYLQKTGEWDPQAALKQTVSAQKPQTTQGPMGAIIQNMGAPRSNTKTPAVGEVRNGIRFLGFNEDGSMKFERVQ